MARYSDEDGKRIRSPDDDDDDEDSEGLENYSEIPDGMVLDEEDDDECDIDAISMKKSKKSKKQKNTDAGLGSKYYKKSKHSQREDEAVQREIDAEMGFDEVVFKQTSRKRDMKRKSKKDASLMKGTTRQRFNEHTLEG